MEITARASHVTVTPRKVQLLANAIRDLRPEDAVAQLNYLNKSAAVPLAKVIRQAIANASENFKVPAADLRFKTIVVTKGMNLRRFQAGARGRGKPYSRTRSHITVILKTKPALKPVAPAKKIIPAANAAPAKKAAPAKPAKTSRPAGKVTKKPASGQK